MKFRSSWRAILLSFACVVTAWCEPAVTYRRDYVRLSSGSFMQDKNFYVLTLFQKLPEVHAALASDPTLKDTSMPFDFYASNSQMVAGRMLLDDQTIESVRTALVRLEPTSPALQFLVTNHLRPSGCYILFENKSDADLLGEAWVEAAHGIDGIIQRYVLAGKADDGIDSPSYDPANLGYRKMIANAAAASFRTHRDRSPILCFEPSLSFALQLLAMNHRDESARHEPLADGENRAATTAAKQLDWAKSPYAALLVLGIGPEVPGLAISDDSRANCAAAAKLYKEGLAPLIIVSGGYVHPKQTIFSEAVEMKQELMLVHGIPESAILIEPQARHTTTNFRNAVRELFALGIPSYKPCVVVSVKEHIDGILSDGFQARCARVFGYQPATYGKRLSGTAAEFTPSLNCLQIDPRDPLDP